MRALVEQRELYRVPMQFYLSRHESLLARHWPDADPAVCHRDSDGHACTCDPGCEQATAPACSCDKTKGVCDVASGATGTCACDVDCAAATPSCSCDSTQACDTAANGDACLCDRSCYPACPCDDANPNTCAHDSAGNACSCDPTCR